MGVKGDPSPHLKNAWGSYFVPILYLNYSTCFIETTAYLPQKFERKYGIFIFSSSKDSLELVRSKKKKITGFRIEFCRISMITSTFLPQDKPINPHIKWRKESR